MSTHCQLVLDHKRIKSQLMGHQPLGPYRSAADYFSSISQNSCYAC